MPFRVYIKIAALALFAATVTPANAENVLYRNDSNIGTDQMAAALAGQAGDNVTSTSGDLSGYNLSNYGLVVYANQNDSPGAGDLAALSSYVAGGGKVIFDDWMTGDSIGNLGGSFSGNTNDPNLTVSSLLNYNLSNPVTLTNPGWGVYTTGLLLGSGGTVAATFGNGDAGIIIGNGGNTIWNGFLTDTLSSSQLFTNELAYYGAASTPASSSVPEPATAVLFAAGMLGFNVARRRKSKV